MVSTVAVFGLMAWWPQHSHRHPNNPLIPIHLKVQVWRYSLIYFKNTFKNSRILIKQSGYRVVLRKIISKYPWADFNSFLQHISTSDIFKNNLYKNLYFLIKFSDFFKEYAEIWTYCQVPKLSCFCEFVHFQQILLYQIEIACGRWPQNQKMQGSNQVPKWSLHAKIWVLEMKNKAVMSKGGD